MSIAEKLITVAENVPKVFNAGQLSVISQSESLKGSASGSSVTIKDISPVEHDVPCKVGSKNLVNLTDFDVNRSITITLDNPLPAGTYTLSGLVTTTAGTGLIQAAYTDGSTSSGSTDCSYTSDANERNIMGSRTYPKAVAKFNIYAGFGWNASAGHTAKFVDFMIEEGSTATEYTPYVDLSTVTVKKYGKNLCNTGTATFTRGITIELPTPLPAKTPFVFSGNFESDYTGSSNLIQFNYTDGTSCSNADMASWSTKKPTERQLCTRANGLPKDLKSISFYAGYGWGNSGGYTGTLTNVQLEIGSTATDYEPYSCTEHTANSDGTVEGIKSLYPNMTLLTDTEGVIVTAEYIKDIDKAFEERLAEIEKALVNN